MGTQRSGVHARAREPDKEPRDPNGKDTSPHRLYPEIKHDSFTRQEVGDQPKDPVRDREQAPQGQEVDQVRKLRLGFFDHVG